MNSLFLLTVLAFSPIQGANILGVFTISSYSHQIVYRNLMLELNKRGHNITIITPDPARNPNLKNYREIDVSYYYKIYNKKFVAYPKGLRIGLNFPEYSYLIFKDVSIDMCQSYYSSPQVQALISENPKFDLLITEFSFNQCFYGLAKFSGFKHMGIYSFQMNSGAHSSIKNPIEPSYIPDVFFPYFGKMNFFQRLRNFIFHMFMFVYHAFVIREQTFIARQYLGQDLPHLEEIKRNVSLVMVNTHFTMGLPRPNLPNIIEIGGPAFHLLGKEPKLLPKDIKDFLDDAPDGVIYFSLGTNVKTSNMSTQVEDILIKSFGKIKQKVLLKWENENLIVNLKNVKKEKWLPQVEVLAHPNVKAFVTQAGLQSIGEAMEFHVPMIVIPFFADQNHNARKMEIEGAALYLDFDSLDVDTFTKALHEIVYNPKYKENIRRLSALVKDQPIPPLEKAVWWTEYVLRHDGAPHLRSAAATMPWYQYIMLDVLAVVFSTVLLILYVFYKILKCLLGIFVKPKKGKTNQKKKIN